MIFRSRVFDQYQKMIVDMFCEKFAGISSQAEKLVTGTRDRSSFVLSSPETVQNSIRLPNYMLSGGMDQSTDGFREERPITESGTTTRTLTLTLLALR